MSRTTVSEVLKVVREYMDKIVVHQRSEPHKEKNDTQQVSVYFNFVGRVSDMRKP